MSLDEGTNEHLTDYERAICYYTLPRLNNPLTFGLIVAYTVCLFEAVGVFLIGLVRGDSVWFVAGLTALAAIVLFGIGAFAFRAFLADLRRRRALAQAQGVPDHSDSFQDFDLPDPFADHILLKHSPARQDGLYRCAGGKASLEYSMEYGPGRNWWLLKNTDGSEALRVRTLEGPLPFAFNSGRPRKLGVYQGELEIATITRPFSFTLPYVQIRHTDSAIPPYLIRNSSIYADNELAGRFYELHGNFYLDVAAGHFQPGLIAYYATLT